MIEQPSVQIRRPRAADLAFDADATATMYLAARRAMLPDLRDPHTEAETRAWMRDTVFTRYSVRLAEVDGEIVGFAARGGAWLMQLYVKPGWTGRTIGTNLLRIVLADAAFATPMLRLYTLRATRARVASTSGTASLPSPSATVPAIRKASPTSATSAARGNDRRRGRAGASRPGAFRP
jgi:hypothetical protein